MIQDVRKSYVVQACHHFSHAMGQMSAYCPTKMKWGDNGPWWVSHFLQLSERGCEGQPQWAKAKAWQVCRELQGDSLAGVLESHMVY
jgi:hypothetical protein